MINSCLIVLGIITSIINSKYLLKIPHLTKIKFMLVMYSVAYAVIGMAYLIPNLFGFFLALVGTLIMGASSTLGEQTNLGMGFFIRLSNQFRILKRFQTRPS